MPPHSEVGNDPFAQIDDVRYRGARRKRSRSISPDYMRKVGQHSNKSSRSSSVSSEIRVAVLPRSNNNNEKILVQNTPVVVSYKEAPPFLQFNPFIIRGYRTNLCTITCLKR